MLKLSRRGSDNDTEARLRSIKIYEIEMESHQDKSNRYRYDYNQNCHRICKWDAVILGGSDSATQMGGST